MKKILATLLVAASITAFATTSALAAYPSSPNPGANILPNTNLIGAEGGWEDNPDVGRSAAFDGDIDTFYDPGAANDPEHYAGIKVNEPIILTEIRIRPRNNWNERFNGASIYGFNDDVFDPDKATLIWESGEAGGDNGDEDWHIIAAANFIAGSNTGFTHFAYWNGVTHGDVAEVELYGDPVPAAAPAEPTKDETPVETPATVEPVVISAPVQTTTAPTTADPTILFAIASALSAGGIVVTRKFRK